MSQVPLELAENQNQFVVPRDALVRQGNEWLLFAVNNNQAQPLTVELLADLGENMAVTHETLQAGTTIVLTGAEGLQPGSTVKIVEE